LAPIRTRGTVLDMAFEDDTNLPVPAVERSSLPDVVEVSDDEARRVLAQFATTDPTVRKRVFSTLLRAISVGGA